MNPNVLGGAHKASDRGTEERRGVLLLVTVCMLTLFLMLGTAYLVAASRARESANAIARKALFADQTNYRPETYLDNVIMQVVRGGNTPLQLVSDPTFDFESLLEDKYGSSVIIGRVSTVPGITPPQIYSAAGAGNTGPVITVPFDDLSGSISHPAELNGRIFTLIGVGRPNTSHRIIRATGSTSPYTLTVTNPRGPHQWAASDISQFSGEAIVNGAEFSGAAGATQPNNEAWDGFDGENPFLAFLEPDSSSVSRTNVRHPSYYPGLASLSALDTIDNDGDGVDDGVFLDWGLPSFPTASGTIDLHASALIVDLDGRFNVNAHGSLANMPIRVGPSQSESIYASSNPNWPRNASSPPDRSGIQAELNLVPLGSGVGPAEVNADHMFSTPALNATAVSGANGGSLGRPNPSEQIAGLFTTGGHSGDASHGQRPDSGRFTTGTNTPQVGAVEGRYGGRGADQAGIRDKILKNQFTQLVGTDDVCLPGAPNGNSTGGQVGDTIMSAYGVPANWWGGTTDSFRSPPDVLGRMKFLTRPALDESGSGGDDDGDGRSTFGLVPRPTYAKAEWAGEHMLSPYNSRLTSTGSRGGKLHAASTNGTTLPAVPTENPFALSELEALLRPYDADSSKLPMRLQAMLGTVAEQMRTRLTTESWDTTAIVDGSAGGAWQTIQNAITSLPLPTNSTLYNSSPVRGALGGEISRGEKFNLNRPLTNTKPSSYDHTNIYYIQRQAYFKDLYTLLVLLNPTATSGDKEEYAQWAANVVEFRDADSTMTPFEYDTNLGNGWDCDGNVRTLLTLTGVIPSGARNALKF